MKYEFIEAMKARGHFVREVCEFVNVPERSYYNWVARKGRPDGRIRANEGEVRTAIVEAHRKSKKRYGRPRILLQLRRQDIRAGGKRVARIMREEGLAGRCGRKRGPRTSSGTRREAAPNLVDRQFNVESPNQVWAGDVTQINVGGVWLYLAVVMDLCSRRIVGFHCATSASAGLVAAAMKDAAQDWLSLGGLTFHSDQGTVYASERFTSQLQVLGIEQSMSRRGNCWDNAPVESFFATLKKELVYDEHWRSIDQLRNAIAGYMSFYNNERTHSSLGYLTPSEYETQIAA